jgi:energy-coupling factor transporter ATP-binding protein EcfA2
MVYTKLISLILNSTIIILMNSEAEKIAQQTDLNRAKMQYHQLRYEHYKALVIEGNKQLAEHARLAVLAFEAQIKEKELALRKLQQDADNYLKNNTAQQQTVMEEIFLATRNKADASDKAQGQRNVSATEEILSGKTAAPDDKSSSFLSKVREEVLKLLYAYPDQQFLTAEIFEELALRLPENLHSARKDWVAAISAAMRQLYDLGLVSSVKDPLYAKRKRYQITSRSAENMEHKMT